MANNPYQPFITDRRSAALPSTPIQMTHPVDTSSVGRAIEGFGEALAGIGIKEQAETDQIQATEAITAGVQKMDDIWGSYAEKTGKEAFESFGDTRQKLNQVVEDAKAAAPNSRQKLAITNSLSHSLNVFDANIMRHRVSEKKSWQDSTSENAINEFGRQAITASDAGYEPRFDLFMKSARDETITRARNSGLDADAATTQANAQTGKFVVEAIQYQVNRGDLKRANGIFEKYKPIMDAANIVRADTFLSGKNMDVKVEQMLDNKFPLTSSNPDTVQKATEATKSDQIYGTNEKVNKPIQERLPPYSDDPRAVQTIKINPETGQAETQGTGQPEAAKAQPEKVGSAVLPSRPSQYDSIVEEAAKNNGISADMLKRYMHIESGAQADARTGSYHGLFQLSRDEFRKYGGNGNIYDPTENANAAAKKIAAEIKEFKAANGRDPTATDIYLQHQQGMGGAAAHLANPGKPAWENMHSTAEGQRRGESWSKLAIWGNIPDDAKTSPTFNKEMFPGGVETVTSQQFMDGWRSKVEGGAAPTSGEPAPTTEAATATATTAKATPGTTDSATANHGLPPIKEALQWAYDASGGDVVLREKLQSAIADRYRAFDQEKAETRAALKRKVDNVVTELSTNGTQSELLTENDFTSAYGAQEGSAQYTAYLDAKKAARVSHELKSAPVTEHDALLQSIKPEAGDPFYADKMDSVNKARILSNKLRSDAAKDSAAFAISTSETVKSSLEAAIKGDANDAAKYISDLREEQRRLKIPPGEWRTLPKDMTQRIADTIADTKDKSPGQVLAFINTQKAKWGNNWDDIVREMKGKLPDALYVASQEGLEPKAAATIIAHSDTNIDDILKSTTVPKRDISVELSENFADFGKSMSETSLGRDESAMIYDQTLKLAAVYATQGKNAGAAAKQAYADIVGERYEFFANRGFISAWTAADAPQIRVPKRYDGTITGDSFVGIKNRVFNHDPSEYSEDLTPLIPSVAGVMADKDEIERDSYFATLPNDSGVALVWRNMYVQKQDGSPLVFTWDKIINMDSEPSGAEKANAAYWSEREKTVKAREALVKDMKDIVY